MKTTKKEAAAEALQCGETIFRAHCHKCDATTEHYVSGRRCKPCTLAENTARQKERYRTETAFREKRRARFRGWREANLGHDRERIGAAAWRNAFSPYGSMSNMTGWYSLEREAICQRYADRREDFEMDHAVPKIAKDAQGAYKASGLHCWANLVETPTKVNRLKQNQFNPDLNRLQRPANRYPGGAFDPEPTEHEWSLIRQNEDDGTPAEVSLRSLRESLDTQAREHEQHVAMILARLQTA
ncbi:hypothetical protein [Burkholderia vietnamiensis]|uniref:hypothetical protein n=1 Tax=Burkholderia vietnamiensis TaxID=60552 RepID=UPI002DD41B78|nr:hypothetical protein [Burkholderia vietnamiensis]MEC4598891.1 hypothetical protein [Burkholderia vietnamiensis]